MKPEEAWKEHNTCAKNNYQSIFQMLSYIYKAMKMKEKARALIN